MARLKKLASLLLAAALCIPLAGCEKKPEAAQRTVLAMDTVMNLTVYGEDEDAAQEAVSLINAWIVELEGEFSATKEDSPVWTLNRTGKVELDVDAHLPLLLEQTLDLCQVTGGTLDITAYPAVQAWGFTTGEYRVPDEAELAALAANIDWSALEMDEFAIRLPEGVEIDLGAVAKGYAGDVLAQGLTEMGISSALLDLGQSSILAVGAKPDGTPWRIGVQDPAGDGYLGVLELTDQAMGTSGSYQRYFEQDGVRYCHIIDPKTAAPAQSGLASVTVVAPSCLLCDGLSTALFVMGLEEGVDFWRSAQSDPNLAFEAIFIEDNGAISVTSGLKDAFALAEGYTDREVTVLE